MSQQNRSSKLPLGPSTLSKGADHGDIDTLKGADCFLKPDDAVGIPMHLSTIMNWSSDLHVAALSEYCSDMEIYYLELPAIDHYAIEELLKYMYGRDIEWGEVDVRVRPKFFSDLLCLADIYNIKGLRERVMKEFKEWTSSNNGQWRDMERDMNLICTFQMPRPLWHVIVQEWAIFLTEGHPVDRHRYEQIINRHPAYANAVWQEIAQMHSEKAN
ncbi:hypothetical protein M409DRAFT_25470 [Zasmidium cellare ATCC 36951]|uniref:Uncharacterized protein n=1 Tax=Zasmidium cellare ATCC 36951 TaxID=1080233 RepID=A0A6A6CAD5_ZASCE|nr:uncharacterized protein M409DRAFT_25470 [Zasmidium cellare ATCC 36951]KAF2164124.1 hypothetical protein M409DRAFT_25470 [Zasmidium cellare ATCC 36951]